MANPSPLLINPIALFVQMTPDVAVMLCRYLTIEEVEVIGSTNKAAHAQFLRLKQRPDFWSSLVPIEHPLKTDWSRPTPEVVFRPPIWSRGKAVDMAMSENGDYLYVVHGPTLIADLTVYRRTSRSPLKFDRGMDYQIDEMRMVGMDNDANHPGVYLWQRITHELWVWQAKKGFSLVGKFPECLNITAHSRNNILYLNVIKNNQLIGQQFKITAQGLIENTDEFVHHDMAHGNCLLKLSPGGHSLMVIDRASNTLVVLNSKTLRPRTGRVIRLENFVPRHLSALSITDGGGTLHSSGYCGAPKIFALDRQDVIPFSDINYPITTRIAHSGDGRQGITTILGLAFNHISEQRTYQSFTLPKILPASLEQAIMALGELIANETNNIHEYVNVGLARLRMLLNNNTVVGHLRTLQAELKHATPRRLSAVVEEFCDIRMEFGHRHVILCILFDLANCLDMEDEHEPIKVFQYYWCGDNDYEVGYLVNSYSVGKKPKGGGNRSKGEMIDSFIHHAESLLLTFGHLLLDLCRQMPKGPTLADVLCQSRHVTDRALHKLIPKRLAKVMLVTPALCNYVILAALMRKIMTWTDNPVKKAQLQATHDAMVRAAEADPNLRFNADRLMNDHHEEGDTVLQCLQDTPYYKTMMNHFQVEDHNHQEKHKPTKWACSTRSL